MLCSARVVWENTYGMLKGGFCFVRKKIKCQPKYFVTCYVVYCTTQCMHYRKCTFSNRMAIRSSSTRSYSTRNQETVKLKLDENL